MLDVLVGVGRTSLGALFGVRGALAISRDERLDAIREGRAPRPGWLPRRRVPSSLRTAGATAEAELRVKVDGRRVASETTCAWVSPYGLVIATVLPEPGLAAEIHSSFVGHAGVPTCAIHLTLGPVGEPPLNVTAQYEQGEVDLTTDPRQCVYEHMHVVLLVLQGQGNDVGIDVPDDAFDGLERVRS